MSIYTPVIITRLYPPSGGGHFVSFLRVELPMPDSVQWNGSSSVQFNWKDPWRDHDFDIPAELTNFLCEPPEKIQTGRTLANTQYAIVQPPGRLCKVEWSEVEPFGGGQIDYQKNGVIAIPSRSFDRSQRNVTLNLYVATKVYLWGAGSLPV